MPFLCTFLLVCGCGQDEVDRAAANADAHSRVVAEGLTVRTEGAAIVDAVAASGDGPPEVVIRAQSFDARIDVETSTCGTRALHLTVTHLPVGTIQRSARPFLGAVEPRVAAGQAAAGGGIRLGYDVHDPQWTPLAPEAAFDAISSQAGRGSGTEERWTLCSDRNRMAWRLLEGHQPTSACRFSTVEAPGEGEGEADGLVDPAAGACVTFDAPDNDPVSTAPLVVRHRLRLDVTADECVRFAVFGNMAGNLDVLESIVDEVRTAEPLFALVTGDLTFNGTADELRDAAITLDGLPVPWYATLGDRDAAGSLTDGYAAWIGASTFAFDAGPVRLMVLDSGDRGLAGDDRRSLARWLEDDRRLWWSEPPPPSRLVFTHVPPFDPEGARGDAFRHRPEAAAVVASLRRGRVPLLFSSQFAVYEEQQVARTRVIHSGGGGAPMELTSGDVNHWLLVTVNGPECVDPPPCALLDATLCPCIDVVRVDVGAGVPTLPECRPAAAPRIGDGL